MANIRKANDWACLPDKACGDSVSFADFNQVSDNIDHYHRIGYTVCKQSGQRTNGTSRPLLGVFGASPAYDEDKIVISFPVPALYGYNAMAFYFNYSANLNAYISGTTPVFVYRQLTVKYFLNGNTATLGTYHNDVSNNPTIGTSGTVFDVVNIPRQCRPNFEQRQIAYIILEFEIKNYNATAVNIGSLGYEGFSDFEAIAIIE